MSIGLRHDTPARRQAGQGLAQRIQTILIYSGLVLVSLLLLFPLFFALSIALQGQTIAPRLIANDTGDALEVSTIPGRRGSNSLRTH